MTNFTVRQRIARLCCAASIAILLCDRTSGASLRLSLSLGEDRNNLFRFSDREIARLDGAVTRIRLFRARNVRNSVSTRGTIYKLHEYSTLRRSKRNAYRGVVVSILCYVRRGRSSTCYIRLPGPLLFHYRARLGQPERSLVYTRLHYHPTTVNWETAILTIRRYFMRTYRVKLHECASYI